MQNRCPGEPGARYCLQYGQTSADAGATGLLAACTTGTGCGGLGAVCTGVSGRARLCKAYGTPNSTTSPANNGQKTTAKGASCLSPPALGARPAPSTPATLYSLSARVPLSPWRTFTV